MNSARQNWKAFPFIAIFSALVLNADATHASIYNFTGSGANAGDTGSAEFTFDSVLDNVTIKLTNTTTTTDDAADLLTGVQFSFGGLTPTLSSALGIQRTVSGTGSFTDTGSPATLSWSVGSLGSGAYQLDFNPDAKNAIIGPPTAGNYSGANGSIDGNPGHTPFAAETATFVIHVTGLLDSTPFTLNKFLYGTGPAVASGTITVGTPPPPPPAVPEPASLVVWTIGCAAVAIGLYRRKSC